MRKSALILIIVSASAVVFTAGIQYERLDPSPGVAHAARPASYYFCPMHPQYHSDQPGDCPNCGMRLVPFHSDETAAEEHSLPAGAVRIQPDKIQSVGVRSARVETWSGTHTLRTTGRIAADEIRLYRLNVSTGLWIRKLHPPTNGSRVHKDEPLLDFYATDFFSAASAYMYALNTRDRQEGSDQGNAAQLQSPNYQIRQAVESLQNLGVSDVDIAEMERTRKARDLVTMRAPADGIILSRTAAMGQWVASSTELYEIADPSHVWIFADMFENEARCLHPGMSATVRLPHQYQSFAARVSDIPPLFDATTRTMKVRLEADNPQHILWPDMFVNAEFPIPVEPALVVPPMPLLTQGCARESSRTRAAGCPNHAW
jgi:Cu(I)/Ag(I) efflux system membrane fusion protein